jgi:hypothetical protein
MGLSYRSNCIVTNSLYTHFVLLNLQAHDERLVHLKDNVHRSVLIYDYSTFLLHVVEFQTTIRTLT